MRTVYIGVYLAFKILGMSFYLPSYSILKVWSKPKIDKFFHISDGCEYGNGHLNPLRLKLCGNWVKVREREREHLCKIKLLQIKGKLKMKKIDFIFFVNGISNPKFACF